MNNPPTITVNTIDYNTYMFEVCRVVEVGDINACTSRGVRSLNLDQLLKFNPPELLLGR